MAGRPRGRSSDPGGVKNFHFSMSSRGALGSTKSPTQWVLGAFSPGVNRPEREADHSPPISAEVKKTWVYTYTSTPYMSSCRSDYLVKYRDNFALTSRETHYDFTKRINRLMMFRKTNVVYCENYTERINTLWAESQSFRMLKQVVHTEPLGCKGFKN
jgi:hypothetical protein